MNSSKVLCFLAMLVLVASMAEAHKKFHSAPIFEPERCLCDCQHRHPVPSKPYYGSGGYHQPRPGGAGYGNAGSYAVAGSYGSGGGQTSGGY